MKLPPSLGGTDFAHDFPPPRKTLPPPRFEIGHPPPVGGGEILPPHRWGGEDLSCLRDNPSVPIRILRALGQSCRRNPAPNIVGSHHLPQDRRRTRFQLMNHSQLVLNASASGMISHRERPKNFWAPSAPRFIVYCTSCHQGKRDGKSPLWKPSFRYSLRS